MANIYDMNAGLKLFDHAGSMQQGVQFGQQQRQLRESREREQQVRNLAPQIVAGDPAAYTQAAAIDPEAAGQYQDAGDAQLRRFKGFVGYIDKAREQAKTTGDWRHVDAALQQASPYLTQLLGKPGPTAWPQGDPQWEAGWEGLKARLAGVEGMGAGQPTGFREFDMKARAAGLQPGTKEYEQAAKIALGVEGRAATGGFGFTKITGGDGRERLVRQNPRTGVAEVYDEATGDFVPLGAPAALNGDSPPLLPAGKPGTTFETENGQILPTTRFTAADGSLVQFDAGVPDVFQQQVLQQPRQFEAAPDGAMANLPPVNRTPQQFRAGYPSLAVSRSPEEQAALTTAAQESAKLQFEPQRQAIETQGAVDRTYGTERAKADVSLGAEQAGLDATRARDAKTALELLDEADQLLPYATGSLIGTAADAVMGAFGESTQGADATAQLQTIAGQLTSRMPRMQGPQSDKDVILYKQMAGDLANSYLPRERRMAASSTIRRLNEKYAGPQQQGGPVRVQSAEDYERLPSGALFIAPDGTQRRKR